jgi:hypothetical protein
MARWLDRVKQLRDELHSTPPDTSDRSLVARLEAGEITWRVAAMRPQVPPRGPIPFLIARSDARRRDAPGHCPSCGESKEPDQRFVCRACQRAKWIVLHELRE